MARAWSRRVVGWDRVHRPVPWPGVTLRARAPIKYSRGIFRIFALRSYEGVHYGPPNNLPFVHIFSAWFEGGQPTVSDQGFGCIENSLLTSEVLWSENTDLSRRDGWFGPSLQPVEQQLCGILVRLFD